MTYLNVVNKELKEKCFKTILSDKNIQVKLTSRKVSKIEVEQALLASFSGINFIISSFENSVLVKL